MTLARIERGAEPGVIVALRLARCVGVAVEDIWTVDGSVPERCKEDRREAVQFAVENRADRGAGIRPEILAWLDV